MLDWEGNIKEKRERASQVVLEDVDDHIDASSLIISVVEMKAIDVEMMHHECEEGETTKYNLPWSDISVIVLREAGITVNDKAKIHMMNPMAEDHAITFPKTGFRIP